jgi:GcrA cell cycle regulator
MERTTLRHADAAPEPAAGAPFIWTDAAVVRLRELWASGRSAAQIAREIGGLSRAAVIGKARRLGLMRAEEAPRSISAVPRSLLTAAGLARAENVFALRVRALALLEAQLQREPVAPEEPSPESRPCAFMELTRHTCRWPVGDPDVAGFHFCGAPPDAGHVYCAHHRHIAHTREEDGDACP